MSKLILTFLRVFWREVSIVTLLISLWGTHALLSNRIEKLKLELTISELATEHCQETLERQSDRIREEERAERKATEEALKNLDSKLDDISAHQSRQLRDILDQTFPTIISENCEELNDYLIDMTSKLEWGDE